MPLPVRIRGPIYHPCPDGPRQGQYALQKRLRRRIADGLDWIQISHDPCQPGELAWFWCLEDAGELLDWDAAGRPWVGGPNLLFEYSGNPGGGYGWLPGAERRMLDSPHCTVIFTESAWYEALIRKHLGPAAPGRFCLWPYPIDIAGPDDPPALPPGPEPARHDLLIYAKSPPPGVVFKLEQLFPSHVTIHYGRFRRHELLAAARRCRACVYLSEDDRGPLALAEILLSGCPTVGIERGAPFVEHGVTGHRIDRLLTSQIATGVEAAITMDRHKVRTRAEEVWDGERIVDTIVSALEEARGNRADI